MAEVSHKLEFQALAVVRLEEAKCLLANGFHSGAYYLCGYAVELALKAIVAKNVRVDHFPPIDAKKFYTHDLEALIGNTGLAMPLATERALDPEIDGYWDTILIWDESTRYSEWGPVDAAKLIEAVSNPTKGGFQWIRRHW